MLAFCFAIVKSMILVANLLWGTRKRLVVAVIMKAMMDAKAMGIISLYKLNPDAFKMVISLSLDNLPNPIRIDIRSETGMVRIKKDGVNKRKSLDISMKLTPLLTIKSMSWRIFPIRRTKVNTKIMMKKGYDISFRIYRLMILSITIDRHLKFHYGVKTNTDLKKFVKKKMGY
jgi:hypothetical protein